VLTLIAALAAARGPALDGCARVSTVSLGARVPADLRTTYAVDGTPLRVCIDRASYPYSARHGHHLDACVEVGLGNATSRFCGGGNRSGFDWHGYTISVVLRRPRFTGACDVWLTVERSGAARSPTQ
jgi:hypothetical protein